MIDAAFSGTVRGRRRRTGTFFGVHFHGEFSQSNLDWGMYDYDLCFFGGNRKKERGKKEQRAVFLLCNKKIISLALALFCFLWVSRYLH